jgi:hypothetical protein
MKHITTTLLSSLVRLAPLLLIAASGCAPAIIHVAEPVSAESEPEADTNPAPISHFIEALDGHGHWIDDPEAGSVWIPAKTEVGEAFVPYATAGHWGYDAKDGSYNWFSSYSWGWATFHYGRWFQRADGWAWVPGATYSPAWVEWRTDSGTTGYRPLPPTIAWRHGVAERVRFANPRAATFTLVAPSGVSGVSGTTGTFSAAKEAGDDESLARARSYAGSAKGATSDGHVGQMKVAENASRGAGAGSKAHSGGGRHGSGHEGHAKR